jgi:hypothetical protein
MRMPQELEKSVNSALKSIRKDPRHEMDPYLRRATYAAFGPQDDSKAVRARGWLAIITAQKVLPIFLQAVPDESNPKKLVEMAIAVVQGKADLKDALRKASEGSDLAGRLWGYDEHEIPFNAQLAGNTGYRALHESAGWNLLERQPGKSTDTDQISEPSRLIDRGDFTLAQIGGDTASAAAIAYSSDPRHGRTDSQRLLVFWQWWLEEAIPSAWKMAFGNS